MELSKIIAVAGTSGLMHVIAQSRNGIIVESLSDGKKFTVPASARISALADISIYGTSEDKPLRDILKCISEKENNGPTTVSAKSSDNELRAYLQSIYPDFDQARVYTSDIKKLITWYNILQQKGILETLLKEPETKDEEKESEKPKTSELVKKPKTTVEKKAPAPKASTKGMAKTTTVRKTGA